MYQRDGENTLPAHVEQTCGITVKKMSRLDVGVFRVDRGDGGIPLVARLFSDARPLSAAEADLAVLRYLAELDFPAERPFGEVGVTSHHGQAVLVTEFVKQAAKSKRPPYPIIALGASIGRLHGLAVPVGADRPAGALHHFADGTMSDELRAVGGWLDSVEALVSHGELDALDVIRVAVARADGGDGLPEALVHPDPVPKNVIFTANGPVLVDWTSAGYGPRLPSMMLVLRSGWAAAPFMKGYARRVMLTDDERARLAELLYSRQLIDLVFRVCRDPTMTMSAAKKLAGMRRDSEAKARDILAALTPS
jgi:aminoglycoside phosphotransferase (APT) family kinase protein